MTDTCDHNVIFFNIEVPSHEFVNETLKFPDYVKGDYESFKKDLLKINFDPVNMYRFDLEEYYNNFISQLHLLINQHIPILTRNKNNRMVPKHIRKL